MTGVNWIDAILIICMAIGAGAGAYSYARNQQTYIDIAKAAVKAAWPYLVVLTRPLNAEDQKKLDQSRRRAEEWDNFRKKPRDR